jgi:hypothetical protein
MATEDVVCKNKKRSGRDVVGYTIDCGGRLVGAIPAMHTREMIWILLLLGDE